MPTYAIRRKCDKFFLGMINCREGILFDKIDEICSPYGLEFTRTHLSHAYTVWFEFKYIDVLNWEIVKSCEESHYE